MKKNIIKVCILSLILLTITSIVILYYGRTFDVVFNVRGHDEYSLSIDNENGKVEVIDEKINGEEYIVSVKAKSPGSVYLNLKFDDYTEIVRLYVHKSMIITNNNYFGESTNSRIIPISISIISIYIMYLLIQKYSKSKKENLFQYKNIAYLGIIIFMSFFVISNLLSLLNYQGLYTSIEDVIHSISFVSFFLLPLAVITFILVTISNIQLIRKEGKSLRNLLGLFFGIIIIVLSILPNFLYEKLLQWQIINIYNLNSAGPYLYNFFESLIYLTIAYLECIFIGTIVIGIKAVKHKVKYDKDYMIILGCQIKKDGSLTPLLKGRVDRAIKFRNDQLKETNKDLIFIPSGGKGEDEVISEAEAMKNYLVEEGIDEKNILIENKSKNTYENIKFSNKLAKKNSNICFSTTNFHVLRAGLIASEQGLILDGIGSKTKIYFWINAFIREFIGTLYSEKKKHIIVFGLIIIIIAIVIWMTYLANNI